MAVGEAASAAEPRTSDFPGVCVYIYISPYTARERCVYETDLPARYPYAKVLPEYGNLASIQYEHTSNHVIRVYIVKKRSHHKSLKF